jgi:hypothetical protein
VYLIYKTSHTQAREFHIDKHREIELISNVPCGDLFIIECGHAFFFFILHHP